MSQPEPSSSRPRDDTLEAVKRRGRELRRRRRLLLVSAPLLAIVATASAVVAMEGDDVRVVSADGGSTTSTRPRETTSTTGAQGESGPTTLVPSPGTSTAPSASTASTTSSPESTTTTDPAPATTTTTTRPAAPARFLARIELSSRTVVAGGTLTGELVVDNRTGGPVHLLEGECLPKWGVHLVGAHGASGGAVFTSECTAEPLTFQAGPTRLPFTVRATHDTCSPSPPAVSGTRPCLPPPDIMPPLPAGGYEARLASTTPSLTAAPVAVEVVTG